MKLKISLGQMDIAFGQIAQNLEKIAQFTKAASTSGSDLILFPELMSTGYDLANCQVLAEPLDTGIFLTISQLAARHHIAIGGTLLERSGCSIFNTFILFNSEGFRVAKYRKIHLFRPMNEDKWLCAGDEIIVASTQWSPTGLATCYDLRFPELFRHFALHQCTLCLIPAEWPLPRSEHWRTLLRARAIENQMFIAAVNRTGTSPTDKFGGASAVINPWGETLIEIGDDETLVSTEIDLGEVDRIRKQIPILEDRRPDIYG